MVAIRKTIVVMFLPFSIFDIFEHKNIARLYYPVFLISITNCYNYCFTFTDTRTSSRGPSSTVCFVVIIFVTILAAALVAYIVYNEGTWIHSIFNLLSIRSVFLNKPRIKSQTVCSNGRVIVEGDQKLQQILTCQADSMKQKPEKPFWLSSS